MTNSQEGTGILVSIWRYYFVVLPVTLLATSLAYFYGAGQATLYETDVTLLLARANSEVVLSEPRDAGDPGRYVRNQAQLVTSTAVLTRAGEVLGDAGAVDPLLVSAEPVRDVDSLVITARDQDPEGARRIANALATAYEQVRIEQMQEESALAVEQLDAAGREVRQELSALSDELDTDPVDASSLAARDALNLQLQAISTRSRQIMVDGAMFEGGVEQRIDAVEEPARVQPRPFTLAGSVALVAFVVASAGVWLFNSTRDRGGRRRIRVD